MGMMKNKNRLKCNGEYHYPPEKEKKPAFCLKKEPPPPACTHYLIIERNLLFRSYTLSLRWNENDCQPKFFFCLPSERYYSKSKNPNAICSE